ncbi:chemotaxis protein [Trinickia sp. LjRoot230]|uniref:chemotaxis protein n=1 Tax=Trinickia sp. LjRoot230 TaxID=3342288 RepID=UPI003ED0C2A0
MSSTLDPDNPMPEPREQGRDTGALGPSDSSDSGSDTAGAKRHDFDRDTELDEHAIETGDAELASDTDRAGTGERSSADGDSTLTDDADIEPDRIDKLYQSGEGESEGEGEPDS